MNIKFAILFIFVITNFLSLHAQEDSDSVYKDLEIRKFYSVGTSSSTNGSQTTYKVNGKTVSAAIYNKYESTWDNMSNCCPCILKSYDENDILLTEAVSCTDCGVGYYKKFYPNGNLKLKGNFKENPTKDWNDIYKRGYCSVQDGKWLHYNDKGQITYIEIWDEGEFIEQKPKSSKVEIWKVELLLNDVLIDTQKVSLIEFHELKISPKYKNSNRDDKLSLRLGVSATGFKYVRRELSLSEFEKIEIKKLIEEVGTSDLEKISVSIEVYHNNKHTRHFSVRLKE